MITVVIPAYNEADNIPSLLTNLVKILTDIPVVGQDFEIIVADDHSSDATFDVTANYGDPRVRCIRLAKRSGSHTAVRAGLDHARGYAVLCLAADGQDDPEAVPAMIHAWRQGAHIVWALRSSRVDECMQSRVCAGLFYHLLNFLNPDTKRHTDMSRVDFYLLDRRVVDAVVQCKEKKTSVFGLISWLGFRQDYVEYQRRPRLAGRSKWTFKNRLRLAKDWAVSFSALPLKLVFYLGLMVFSVGMLYALILILNAFLGRPPEGWTSVMVLIVVLSGLQMLMLGIIGEYLWRNLNESRKRPLYCIERSSQDPPLSNSSTMTSP